MMDKICPLTANRNGHNYCFRNRCMLFRPYAESAELGPSDEGECVIAEIADTLIDISNGINDLDCDGIEVFVKGGDIGYD